MAPVSLSIDFEHGSGYVISPSTLAPSPTREEPAVSESALEEGALRMEEEEGGGEMPILPPPSGALLASLALLPLSDTSDRRPPGVPAPGAEGSGMSPEQVGLLACARSKARKSEALEAALADIAARLRPFVGGGLETQVPELVDLAEEARAIARAYVCEIGMRPELSEEILSMADQISAENITSRVRAAADWALVSKEESHLQATEKALEQGEAQWIISFSTSNADLSVNGTLHLNKDGLRLVPDAGETTHVSFNRGGAAVPWKSESNEMRFCLMEEDGLISNLFVASSEKDASEIIALSGVFSALTGHSYDTRPGSNLTASLAVVQIGFEPTTVYGGGMNVKAGEAVRLLTEESGWSMVVSNEGWSGWVPSSHIDLRRAAFR